MGATILMAALALSCAGPGEPAPRKATSANTTSRPGTSTTRGSGSQEDRWRELFGTEVAKVQAFCRQLPDRGYERVSIGVMPLIYKDDSGMLADPPWHVPVGGVDVAEYLWEMLQDAGSSAVVYSPVDVALRLGDQRLPPAVLRMAADVRGRADLLGFDVVVYGEMRKSKVSRKTKVTQVEFRVSAVDVASGRRIGRTAIWTVRADVNGVRPLFDALEVEDSGWDLVAAYEPPQQQTNTVDALNAAERILGVRLNREIEPTGGSAPPVEPIRKASTGSSTQAPGPGNPDPAPEVEGGIAPPPDVRPGAASGDGVYITQAYSPAYQALVERERSAKDALDRARREIRKEASLAGKDPDWNTVVNLDGREFPDFAAAEAHVDSLGAELAKQEKGGPQEFCREVGTGVANSVLPLDRHRIIPVGDLKVAVLREVAGQARTGTLQGEDSVLGELRSIGVSVVVVPYFEDNGSFVAIRCRIIDLRDPGLAKSIFVTIDPRHYEEIKKLIGE